MFFKIRFYVQKSEMVDFYITDDEKIVVILNSLYDLLL